MACAAHGARWKGAGRGRLSPQNKHQPVAGAAKIFDRITLGDDAFAQRRRLIFLIGLLSKIGPTPALFHRSPPPVTMTMSRWPCRGSGRRYEDRATCRRRGHDCVMNKRYRRHRYAARQYRRSLRRAGFYRVATERKSRRLLEILSSCNRRRPTSCSLA